MAKIKICQVIQNGFGFQNITPVKQTYRDKVCLDFVGILFWKQYKRKGLTHFQRDDAILGSAPSAVPSKILSLANLSDNKTTLSSVYIMDKNGTRFNVQLYIYDLSKGMARNLSPIMLGEYR